MPGPDRDSLVTSHPALSDYIIVMTRDQMYKMKVYGEPDVEKKSNDILDITPAAASEEKILSFKKTRLPLAEIERYR